MILLDRITKTYPGDEEPALDNISLHIEPHEFVFLVGKSGAGKSTLIKMITKEEQPDSGKIIIGGIDLDYVKRRHIPHYRRRLGVVFQDYKLFPTRTVFENVAFVLEIAGMSGREIQRTVPKVLDLVGLESKANRFPGNLSGGEKQRVAIARSVARQPKILIADEPTGNLDVLTRQEIIELLQKINDFGTTLLVTTHDENIVNTLSKRVITLKDGRIVDDQKSNGVYRLDNQPEPEITEPIVTPHLVIPGEKFMQTFATVSKDDSSLKIHHPVRSRTTKKSVARSTSPSKTAKVKAKATSPKSASTPKPTTAKSATKAHSQSATHTPQPAGKSLAQDSANQWYRASRPLKSAPKLSDFNLGQTIKLKPAPSMMQATRPTPPRKTKQKQVI